MKADMLSREKLPQAENLRKAASVAWHERRHQSEADVHAY
jgi:hypothetical protein